MTAEPARDPVARTILNLGSGRDRMDDAVNLDVTPDTGPDIVHDLNRRPWPFPDNRFHRVHAKDVIEHLDDVAATMAEIHRVCAPGATVSIVVPHFSSDNAYMDPTHRHYFSLFTFDYFADGHPLNFYTRARFRTTSAQIVFRPSLVNKIVWRLARRFPRTYEQRWAWIFPAWFLAVELEAVK